jgi:ABC transport system ATP-binding/permease protein
VVYDVSDRGAVGRSQIAFHAEHPSMSLLALDGVTVAFGHLPLLDAATLHIAPGERVAVLGRNGTGKTTLLRVVSGEVPPDSGTRRVQPGVGIARLEQDVPLTTSASVFDVVAEGLGELSELVRAYHAAARAVAADSSPRALNRLANAQHHLEQHDAWRVEQRVETVLARLSLPADAPVDTLSGGWRRRALLARSLVAAPDLLLLDEPTNHLDIDAIAWLETMLADYAGAVVFVTHDRAFLQRLATRIVELDRGRLTSWPGDYATYLARRDAAAADQAAAEARFDRKLAEEEAWLRQGIKARRTRNEGRVRALLAMRTERAARRAEIGRVRLQAQGAEATGKLVFEVKGVTFGYGERTVVRDFTCRVLRGDRIGVIGPNGSGKTTLLRLLLGELTPQSGTHRVGAHVQVAYFDQQREQLDPERTVADIVGEGNDVVTVNGQTRHVLGYLRDFLFPAERATSPVKALSGGERNRLLLARLFTRPANVLVLDEPTNDLDIETLELLEALLADWPGTLLLVSHDRVFLDHVVTSTLVFEGDGRVQEYVGGYDDWIRQARPTAPGDQPVAAGLRKPVAAGLQPRDTPAPPAREALRRLSYNEQRELAQLPDRIAALDVEQSGLSARIAAPAFYREPPDAIAAALARLAEIDAELMTAYARWDELDSRDR